MIFRRMLCFWIIVNLLMSSTIAREVYAQNVLAVPKPGMMVNLSPAYDAPLIKAVTVHKDNPLLLDFIIDTADAGLPANSPEFRTEANLLLQYFFACLSIPQKDLWVNLSPYEKERMIPEALGQTALGKDLLAQDYVLKQLTSSLIYPENNLGKEFWDRVYAKVREVYGTTEIPVNAFNKVWIIADRADVHEEGQTAFVINGHLKVMLEEDFLASIKQPAGASAQISSGGTSQIIREIILPEIENEVNKGKNFSRVRQIFYSLILATWYKNNLKQALLNQVYADSSIIKGIDLKDLSFKKEIYEQYLSAYRKGTFNYVKEEQNPLTQEVELHKYFSGGFVTKLSINLRHAAPEEIAPKGELVKVEAITAFDIGKRTDAAMSSTRGRLEVLRHSLDEYIADSKSKDLYQYLRTGSDISYKQFRSILKERFNNLYQDHPHGALNPVQLIARNAQLKDFLLRVFNVRKIRPGIDPNLMEKIFNKLIEYADDPELARHRVYDEVIDFDQDENWNRNRGRKNNSEEGPEQVLSFIELLDMPQNAVIVNVGANRSPLGSGIAERFPGVTMIDSDILSAKTVRWENEKNLSNLRFHQQPGPTDMGLKNQSIDIIILSSMLHHVTALDMDKFIKELRRILKPGGRIILREDSFSYRDPIVPSADFNESLTRELLGHDEEFIINAFIFIDWFANTVMRKQIMPMPFNFQSRETWRDIFSHYGFLEERGVSYGMPYMRTVQQFRLAPYKTRRIPVPVRIDASTRTDLLLKLVYTQAQKESLGSAYGIRSLQRAGWVYHDIPQPESVADHSWGVTLLTLLFAPASFDLKRVMAMAAMHDIAEGPMKKDYRPGEIDRETKHRKEEQVFSDLIQPFSQRDEWNGMFGELTAGVTPEAKFVKVADRFDMWLQARIYQRKYGDRIDFLSFFEDSRKVIVEQGELGKNVLDIMDHPSRYADLLEALERIYDLKRSTEIVTGVPATESPASKSWALLWTYLTTTSLDQEILPVLKALIMAPVVSQETLKSDLNTVARYIADRTALKKVIETVRSREEEGLIMDLRAIVDKISIAADVNASQLTVNDEPVNKGGIDLSAFRSKFSVTIDDHGGVKVDFNPVMIAEFRKGHFGEILPVILRITPVKNVFPVPGGV